LTNSSGPSWRELTPAQQKALAPLVNEWKNFGPARKSKWLQIADKYASMTTEEQHRLQEKMRDWVKMSPEERRIARENYTNSKKITKVEKTEKWQQYQQLPEEQKKKLAADATVKKQVANLPAPGSSKQGKVGPPLKTITRPASNNASSSASSKASGTAKPLPGSPAGTAPVAPVAGAVPMVPVAGATVTPAPAAATPPAAAAAPAAVVPATPFPQPSPAK
jgi:translation initiation factor 1 (eIF-1/SUI1)